MIVRIVALGYIVPLFTLNNIVISKSGSGAYAGIDGGGVFTFLSFPLPYPSILLPPLSYHFPSPPLPLEVGPP